MASVARAMPLADLGLSRPPDKCVPGGVALRTLPQHELPRDEPQKYRTLSGASQPINGLLEIVSPTPKRH
jgi:hypothetical protein